ncbi:hypothetical protein V6N13_033067 [Hibiscus sabdariffa]|uniref:Peptidase C14 caspase domain-containing protein n=1 Tax=Hibiscus sabdariffa TaxID=183260 RepID=A0ABR2FBI1_9ROSI
MAAEGKRTPEGNRKAVLVGCNYPNTHFRLHGCINDVLAMKKLIMTGFGFAEKNITVLIDDPDTSSNKLPTRTNIMRALEEMVNGAKAGDVLFFHFSGKGTILPSLEPHQHYDEHEAIVPCDLNLITGEFHLNLGPETMSPFLLITIAHGCADMDLRCLIKDLAVGASFTIVSDSCHSGGLIDKHKEQIGPSKASARGIHPHVHYKARTMSARSLMSCLQYVWSSLNIDNVVGAVTTGAHVLSTVASAINNGSSTMGGIASALSGIFKEDVSTRFLPQNEQRAALSRSKRRPTEDEGILLSGCQANETCADLTGSKLTGGQAHGAFTNALVQVLGRNKDRPLTNKELVVNVREFLQDQRIEQHPCLYCSDANADTPFLETPTKYSPAPDKPRTSDKNKRKTEAKETPTSDKEKRAKKAYETPPSPTIMSVDEASDDSDE